MTPEEIRAVAYAFNSWKLPHPELKQAIDILYPIVSNISALSEACPEYELFSRDLRRRYQLLCNYGAARGWKFSTDTRDIEYLMKDPTVNPSEAEKLA